MDKYSWDSPQNLASQSSKRRKGNDGETFYASPITPSQEDNTPSQEDKLKSVSENQSMKSGSQHTNSFDTPIPEFYIIIGRGIAAWYNHVTLLCDEGQGSFGKKRLNGLPVMHIGFEELWQKRKNERMGQWPRMLDLFEDLEIEELTLEKAWLTNSMACNDWMESHIFGKLIQKAQDWVGETSLKRGTFSEGTFPVGTFEGFVGIIEPHGVDATQTLKIEKERRAKYKLTSTLMHPSEKHDWLGTSPYRVSVYLREGTTLKMTYVYARKIDVCTGPGVPRKLTLEQCHKNKDPYDKDLYDKDLYDSQLVLDQPPSKDFQKIIDGNSYIGRENDKRHSTVVYKGTAVGAQSVQALLDMPKLPNEANSVKKVWWISDKAFYPNTTEANVPGGRNLLEIVGNTLQENFGNLTHSPKELKQLNQEIEDNFGEGTSQKNAFDERMNLFTGRLHRVQYHALQKVELKNGKIECTFEVTAGRNKEPDIKLPDKALTSTYQMCLEAAVQINNNKLELIDKNICLKELTNTFDDSLTFISPETLTSVGKAAFKITADQLVFALGQEYALKQEGHAGYLVQLLDNPTPIKITGVAGNFPLGFQWGRKDTSLPDVQSVRVLGAAMQSVNEALSKALGEAMPKENQQLRSDHMSLLPGETHAGGAGLNLNIPCIRRANGVTPKRYKLSTSTKEELNKAGFDEAEAKLIISIRSASIRSYTLEELLKVASTWTPTSESEKAAQASIPTTAKNNEIKICY